MSNFFKTQPASFFSNNRVIPLLFLLAITSLAFSQKVNIKGSFWDDSNGVDLKTQVYGIKDGQKMHLVETDTTNLFDFQLPSNIQSLTFESAGYDLVSFPIHFVGKFTEPTLANLSINTKGSYYQYSFKDLVIFCLPHTYQQGNKYELLTVRNDSLFRNMDFSFIMKTKSSVPYPLSEKSLGNKYKVVTTNSKNEIIHENDFFANKGLTFVDINTYPTELLVESQQNNNLNEISAKEDKLEPIIEHNSNLPYSTFGSRNLYFDQSKFELKSENKLVLDSLAKYLLQKMETRINVTGYTDNVGSEELNAVLAKYRTQVVANYLQNKGVKIKQLQLKWNTQHESAQNSGNDLSKFRKVQLNEIY